jgi:hypothetical protein
VEFISEWDAAFVQDFYLAGRCQALELGAQVLQVIAGKMIPARNVVEGFGAIIELENRFDMQASADTPLNEEVQDCPCLVTKLFERVYGKHVGIGRERQIAAPILIQHVK